MSQSFLCLLFSLVCAIGMADKNRKHGDGGVKIRSERQASHPRGDIARTPHRSERVIPPQSNSSTQSGHRHDGHDRAMRTADPSAVRAQDLHRHGNRLHDHQSNTFYHRHEKRLLHDHQTGDLIKVKPDGSLKPIDRRVPNHPPVHAYPYSHIDPYSHHHDYFPYEFVYRTPVYVYQRVISVEPYPVVIVERPGQTSDSVGDFIVKAEQAFRSSDYPEALRSFRHALVEDPKNGLVLLMLAQCHFALSEFSLAAGATQQGMTKLSPEEWGIIVENYREFYGNPNDFQKQLEKLKHAVVKNPSVPALRFVLGYTLGFLGERDEAIQHLDALLRLAPEDELGVKLREIFLKN